MNLNKLLCKYLGRDGRGYVTIGDLVTATSRFAFLSTIALSYVRGVTTIMEYWNGNVLDTLDSALRDAGMIDGVCIPIAAVGTGLILTIALLSAVAVFWIALDAAWGVKIAKCERKDGDETS